MFLKGRDRPPHTINFPRGLLLCKGDAGAGGRDLGNLTVRRPVHVCTARLFYNEKVFVYYMII